MSWRALSNVTSRSDTKMSIWHQLSINTVIKLYLTYGSLIAIQIIKGPLSGTISTPVHPLVRSFTLKKRKPWEKLRTNSENSSRTSQMQSLQTSPRPRPQSTRRAICAWTCKRYSQSTARSSVSRDKTD